MVPGTTPQQPNTVIGSAMFNAAMDDIANTFNTPQPTAYGGTGATSAVGGWDGLVAKGIDIVSASTINLTTATGARVDITGTTTITGVTMPDGSFRIAKATGAFQLTASATLVVNKSTTTNYTTTAGDLLFFYRDGSAVSVTTAGVPSSLSLSAQTPLTLTYADNGASAGPSIDLFRDSASPAVSDTLGQAIFNGRDTAGNKQEYAALEAYITTATSGNERGGLRLYTTNGGSRVLQFAVDGGLFIGPSAGSAGGAGTVAANGYYKNGTELLTLGTLVAASGTTVDFTSLPTGVKRITVMITGLSSSGSSTLLLQLGDSGGIENTGYTYAQSTLTGAAAIVTFSAGFGINSNSAANAMTGLFTLTLMDATNNTWVCDSKVTITTANYTGIGSKSLSATLDRVRLTFSNGTDTFDAGNVNILYEV